MADYQELSNLFDKQITLPKYTHKRWVKIHPAQNDINDNGNGLTQAIHYKCSTVSDRLVNYSDGYILLTITASRAALANKEVVPKGSFAFINQAVVRVNGQDVDNSKYNFVSVPILNSLEYSNDYARVAAQYCYSKDTSGDHQNNSGHTTRKGQIPDAGNNELKFSVKIPLKYVSTFFRALDFPLINQVFEFDITYRTNNALLREGGAAVTCAIDSAILYLPVVELPNEYQAQLLKKMSSGSMTKSLVWNRLHDRVGPAAVNGRQDIQLEASLDGVRKLYCVAVPTARWDNQEHIESTSDTKLTAINIVLDSEDLYPQDIQNDIEAYELVAENFSMGGRDPTTGAVLDYNDWLSTHRYYVFDLSRQKVFESDPMKAQTIRFRGTLSANSRLLFFIAKEKVTTFDFTNPSATKTI